MAIVAPIENAETEAPISALAPADRLDERRASHRISHSLSAELRAVGESDRFVGTTADVSEGGVFLKLSEVRKLRVGQRCEVVLREDRRGGPFGAILDEPLFATVVRTASAEKDSHRGAGLRFDQPLFF